MNVRISCAPTPPILTRCGSDLFSLNHAHKPNRLLRKDKVLLFNISILDFNDFIKHRALLKSTFGDAVHLYKDFILL